MQTVSEGISPSSVSGTTLVILLLRLSHDKTELLYSFKYFKVTPYIDAFSTVFEFIHINDFRHYLIFTTYLQMFRHVFELVNECFVQNPYDAKYFAILRYSYKSQHRFFLTTICYNGISNELQLKASNLNTSTKQKQPP